jgi:hypothetical protein
MAPSTLLTTKPRPCVWFYSFAGYCSNVAYTLPTCLRTFSDLESRAVTPTVSAILRSRCAHALRPPPLHLVHNSAVRCKSDIVKQPMPTHGSFKDFCARDLVVGGRCLPHYCHFGLCLLWICVLWQVSLVRTFGCSNGPCQTWFCRSVTGAREPRHKYVLIGRDDRRPHNTHTDTHMHNIHIRLHQK